MATITEDYVNFEIAKLLKEKRFDVYGDGSFDSGIEVFAEYSPSGILNKCIDSKPHKKSYPAPTLQMTMKWLREVHNLDIIAPPQFDSSKWTYSGIIFKLSIPCTEIRLNDNKYKKEGACEAAIKYCLENLI